MPCPWSSVDEGEGWVWGDFIICFQKEPKELMGFTAKSYQGSLIIKYFYSMVVFYHPERNPHYPSKCPILAVSLEQSVKNLYCFSKNNPLFFGVFHQGGLKHTNHGAYRGEIEVEEIKQNLFRILSEYLELTGDPCSTGTLKDTLNLVNNSIEIALNKNLNHDNLSADEKNRNDFLLHLNTQWSKLAKGQLSKEEAAEFDKEMTGILKSKSSFSGIDIFNFPSMATPFSSIDEGEVWIWDHYFCLFQKKPKAVYEAFPDMFQNIPAGLNMTYHFAMTVLDRFVPEPNPIMSVGIEQIIQDDYKGAIFLGMFSQQGETGSPKHLMLANGDCSRI